VVVLVWVGLPERVGLVALLATEAPQQVDAVVENRLGEVQLRRPFSEQRPAGARLLIVALEPVR